MRESRWNAGWLPDQCFIHRRKRITISHGLCRLNSEVVSGLLMRHNEKTSDASTPQPVHYISLLQICGRYLKFFDTTAGKNTL